MTTGFTAEEVRELEELFTEFVPPEPTLADAETAPKVERVAFAGTEKGLLLGLDFGAEKQNLFLNPVVARALLEGVAKGGDAQDWWSALKDGSLPLAPPLTRADLEGAINLLSLRTGNVPDGLLVVAAGTFGMLSFFLEPSFAAATASTITTVAKQVEWWDDNYEIVPGSDTVH